MLNTLVGTVGSERAAKELAVRTARERRADMALARARNGDFVLMKYPDFLAARAAGQAGDLTLLGVAERPE